MQIASQPSTGAPVFGGRRATWRRRDLALDGTVSIVAYEAGRSDADRTIVFVHGLGQWTQAAWDYVAAALEPTHRIIALDLPGFGESSKPDRAYPLRFFRDALEAVVEAFALDRFSLAGHSLGGLVAASYAARQPSKVVLLALVAPAGFDRTRKLWLRILGSNLLESVVSRIRPSRRFVRDTLEKAVYDPASVDGWVHDELWRFAGDPGMIRAFARVYRDSLHDFAFIRRLHADLARYRGPALVVWGRDDRYVPIRALAAARAVYPHAEVVVFERCGHCPNIEFPEELAQRLVAAGA